MLSAGARDVVCAVVEYLMLFLSSLPTAKLLVAVLISFLTKEEQTSHFARLARDLEWAASSAGIVLAPS